MGALRVGLVAAGSWAAPATAPLLATCPETELTAAAVQRAAAGSRTVRLDLPEPDGGA